MKRLLALAVLALALVASSAQAQHIGIGVQPYGGLSFPIIQDDTGSGPVYGLRVPVKVIPMITLEPYYLTSDLGEGEEEIGGITYERQGFDHTGFGLNAILGSVGGTGIRFYPFAGIGSHKLERDDYPEIKETAYNFGLGLGIGATPKISVEVRGELNMVVTGDTSRKFANATVGLNYGLMP
jgi:opacity protein-like surface antigen